MTAREPVAGTYHFFNLGCPKNLVDAERVAAHLEADGWRETEEPADASLIVITTCAFIASAREESVDEIVQTIAARRPDQRIAVLGCLVTREGADTLKRLLPEVEIFCEVNEMTELAARLREPPLRAGRRLVGEGQAARAPRRCAGGIESAAGTGGAAGLAGRRKLFTPPHFAYLKIAEGCSNRCAYCAIPAIRGELRSRPRSEILAEARDLAARGVRELVIIAQDTTAWGFDRRGGERVYDLIEAIADTGLFDWIRLLYTHPAHLDPARIVPLIRGGALVPYLDVPVQHASDRVLERMGRPYKRRDLDALFDALRGGVADLVLRTTVMVGFPGERESDFREVVSLLESVSFDHVGVFVYSREQGTAAAALGGRVAARVAAQRRDELLEMQMDISAERLAARVGGELDILVDEALSAGERPVPNARFAGRFFGQTHEIDGVTYLAEAAVEPGSIVRARVTAAGPYDLFAYVLFGDE
jgi:ribosomal protein S12 methylthiotransferase